MLKDKEKWENLKICYTYLIFILFSAQEVRTTLLQRCFAVMWRLGC